MTKSQQSKENYSLRREVRVRRDKTAAILLPWFLDQYMKKTMVESVREEQLDLAITRAVEAADLLLKVLDWTRKDLAPPPAPPYVAAAAPSSNASATPGSRPPAR